MATMAAEPRFVDTNILVYASQLTSPWHDRAEAVLRAADADSAELWISDQILREYLSVVTRLPPSGAGVPMREAIEHVRFFIQRFWMAQGGALARAELLTLLATYPTAGKQVHDANIVATMLANGVTHLLTNNVADFRRFEGLITVEAP